MICCIIKRKTVKNSRVDICIICLAYKRFLEYMSFIHYFYGEESHFQYVAITLILRVVVVRFCLLFKQWLIFHTILPIAYTYQISLKCVFYLFQLSSTSLSGGALVDGFPFASNLKTWMSGVKPNLHLKARIRDNNNSTLNFILASFIL